MVCHEVHISTSPTTLPKLGRLNWARMPNTFRIHQNASQLLHTVTTLFLSGVAKHDRNFLKDVSDDHSACTLATQRLHIEMTRASMQQPLPLSVLVPKQVSTFLDTKFTTENRSACASANQSTSLQSSEDSKFATTSLLVLPGP
ncbi:hypothetical protein BaRGS_00006689 [Batillaria attramentaria]|uniref:Uncharacterized protein n=1 Tax=Batillaria attramentaria TaxID=370345 RepID=A0ABD0LRI2_9CAEN